jgi:iron complex outermembrane receptor protein
MSQSPEWAANLNAQYTDSIGDSGLEWFLRGEMAYRGSAYAHAVGLNGDPLQLMPSYTLFNASLGLFDTGQGWRVSAWVKNLTNENYLTQVVRQPAGSDANNVLARVGMERTIGITASYDF